MTKSHPLRVASTVSVLVSAAWCAFAQAPPPMTAVKTPAQSVGLYVFPQKNQTAAVQQ
jgi:hypothetical protein